MSTTTDYQQQAINFLTKTGAKVNVKYLRYGSMPWDKNGEERDIYKITLRRGKKSYSCEFGQSIADQGVEPSAYDFLTSIEKYDPGSFEDFCDNYGYNDLPLSEYPKVKKTYEAVVKQWKAMESMFTAKELEELQEIQ